MTDTQHPEYPPEITQIVQRLFRMRHRFKLGVPDNLTSLRAKIHASKLKEKAEGINNLNQFHNIGAVFAHYDGPITMGELSRELNIPVSSATRIMDWMVENGYVQRLPDPQDRRIVRVGLTESGREIYRTLHEFILDRARLFLQPLTPQERQTFLSLLLKVLDAIDQQSDIATNDHSHQPS